MAIQFYYKDWQGVSHKKNKRGFKTKAEAEQWERDFLQQQQRNLDINFENFVQIYYEDMEHRLRENTMRTKKFIIDLKIIPYFKKKNMNEIKASDIRAWQNALMKKGYSETYLKTVNNQLSAIFNYAVRYYDLKDKGESLDGGMNFTEPLNVIYQSAEDDLADTVKHRLEQAGADCEKISVIDEKIKSLSMIDERLEEAVIKTGAKLLILDPIQAYLGGGMDNEQIQKAGLANEARDMTKKLAALAEKYQCAIVLEADWNNRLGHNEQCEQSSHQRQEIKRHIEEWVR